MHQNNSQYCLRNIHLERCIDSPERLRGQQFERFGRYQMVLSHVQSVESYGLQDSVRVEST